MSTMLEVLIAAWGEQRPLLLELEGTDAAEQACEEVAWIVHDQRWLCSCLQTLARGRPPEPLDPEAQRRQVEALAANFAKRPWRTVVEAAERAATELRAAVATSPAGLLDDERLSPYMDVGGMLPVVRVLDGAIWKPLERIAAALHADGHSAWAIPPLERLTEQVLKLPLTTSIHASALHMLARAYRREGQYHQAIRTLREVLHLSGVMRDAMEALVATGLIPPPPC